jgi:hypothetical protein
MIIRPPSALGLCVWSLDSTGHQPVVAKQVSDTDSSTSAEIIIGRLYERKKNKQKNRKKNYKNQFITVMDKGTKMCVDPGGNGAILSAGERGGPCLPGGEENGQLASDSGGG